jgi:hypothetical protein
MQDILENFVFEVVESCLFEGMRIQHAEDLIFWEGSKGALRSIKSIMGLEKEGYKNLTIKWDGSPTVVFGRDSAGRFVLTNKAGFLAKGYDGKAKSGEDLEKMFLNMGKIPADEKPPEYKAFAANMKNLFKYFENSTPKDFRGFFSGDMLYLKRPEINDGKFTFKPGIVTYSVEVNSNIGGKIAKSQCGVVLHRQMDVNGENEIPVRDLSILLDAGVFFVPPVTVQHPPSISKEGVSELLNTLKSYSSKIDALLDEKVLRAGQLSNFSEMLYSYTNSKVDSGLSDLGKDFGDWIKSNKTISEQKKKRTLEHISKHKEGFIGLWKVVSGIMQLKENVIDQLENQPADVQSSIGTDYKGGEGYVLSHPDGDIKFVSRPRFTAASRAAHRKPELTEGGNVFKDIESGTNRILRKDVEPTIKWLESITNLPLLSNTLGTTGKNETSGDLDIAVDEKFIDKNKLAAILSNWCSAHKLEPKSFVKKSGDSVHFRTPILGDPHNGFVQTDFMFGDPEWMKWSLRGGKENSQYKGMHRHVLLASIAKFRGFKWSYKNGIVNRETDEIVTKDPNKIAEILLGSGSTAKDLEYFETVLDKIKKDKDYENMVSDARNTLLKYGVKF